MPPAPLSELTETPSWDQGRAFISRIGFPLNGFLISGLYKDYYKGVL